MKRYHFWRIAFVVAPLSIANLPALSQEPLVERFDGRFGQVEVGGPFAGAEFHDARPLPSRISFYSPVANSIDLSTDYWKRGDSQPMVVGLRVNDGPRERIGTTGWAYALSPHKVRFEGTPGGLTCSMTYEFCSDQPAMVFRLLLRNTGKTPVPVVTYTHLRLSLRSCQTFARFDSAWSEYQPGNSSIVARFDDPQIQRAACFVENAGERPVEWTTSSAELNVQDDGGTRWVSSGPTLRKATMSHSGKSGAVAAFVYKKVLAPGDSLDIIQVIGSCAPGEVLGRLARLARGWKSEIRRYEERVRRKALMESPFITGDSSIDRSAAWAKAILVTNAHVLDGKIVPMPCPAEYNFFFTHDLLLTDLAAVYFDPDRVRRDLRYVASLAKDSIIPHAYYWRDDGYKTEYCTPDNWNHLWFIIAAGSYLRHSLDEVTGQALYPLVTKSLQEALGQRKGDNLMYGFRPDWWDLGHIEGPRAYLTILTIRALREYVALSVRLGRGMGELHSYEAIADSMQDALVERMWDGRRQYLMDRNGDIPDPHYYMGPLLGAAFGVLDDAHARELVATAEHELLDSRLGVRTAVPPDFHTPAAIAFYKFAGEEAGKAWLYINGGVWPHCNAWYAVSLARLGRSDEAFEFVKRTMTLDGMTNSPRGQPAMFEYRFSDSTSPAYGSIDKPSFLWAAGFTMYTFYRLFGVEDNCWNVSLAGPIPSSAGEVSYSLTLGSRKTVKLSGMRGDSRRLAVDGKEIPSAVVPLTARHARSIVAESAAGGRPGLVALNAVLYSAEADKDGRKIRMTIFSFKGHHVMARFASGSPAKRATLNGRPLPIVTSTETGNVMTVLRYASSGRRDRLVLEF